MKRISLASLENLALSDQGLRDSEVRDQRSRFGTNTIIDSGRHRWWDVLRDTVRDPMVWFLAAVGVMFFVTGQVTEALTLSLAILPLIFMDAFLHWRTKSATISLRGKLNTRVRILRAGDEKKIDAQEIVPGDLVKIGNGEVIPADGIFEKADGIQVDESVLTGESLPMKKKSYQIRGARRSSEDVFVDPEVLAFAGTRVLTGEAFIRILQTGRNTAYGEIVRSVSEMPLERTPLQSAIARLVRTLIFVSLFFCLLLTLIYLIRGHSWIDSLLAAATLAVAAIPEEFPVVFTFFLGVGTYRLAKRRALVRRAVSVENIGRITHICTDKTGTITEGKLTLSHLLPAKTVVLPELIEAAVAASNLDAFDPLDLAILKYAQGVSGTSKPAHVVRRFPFTEDRKKETVVVPQSKGFVAYLKGAPEVVLDSLDAPEETKKLIRENISRLANTGHKVIACAKRIVGSCDPEASEPVSDFSFLGLLAFEDPARPEVREAVASAQSYGIKVIMITGDHPATAAAIAREIGLGGTEPHVVSADTSANEFELESLIAHPGVLASVDVVARCTPLQKLRIVQALKRQGHLVAVTGDGVNDVPALKAADVGIAMGERGSQSAKEVSSIILADDNFKTIIGAIQEGRQLFRNLRSSFEYLLLIHIPLVLSAALLPLLGYPILYLPIHIVWLELIIHPSAILAFQSNARVSHRRSDLRLFDLKDILKIVLSGLLVLALIVWFSIRDLHAGLGEDLFRTRAVGCLVVWSVGLVWMLTRGEGRISKTIIIATFSASVLFIQFGSWVGSHLHVVPLDLWQWGEIFGAVSLICALTWYLKSERADSLAGTHLKDLDMKN